MLPLYPLEGRVLFPGQDLRVQDPSEANAAALTRAEAYGDTLVASLIDGASVHEIAVTALVSRPDGDEVNLHGVARCRLLALVDEATPLVRARRLPDAPASADRASYLAALLLARYERLCRALGRPHSPSRIAPDLAAITWSVTADLNFTAEQQQGFLNMPDAVTRGRLLLVAVRELERRERFLRPWAHLRAAAPWN